MEATLERNSKSKSVLKAILFCVVFTVLFIVLSFTKSFFPNNVERLAHGLIGMAAALATTFLFLKFDHKSFADIGLQWEQKTLLRFFIGFVAGIIIMGLLATSVLYFSAVTVQANPSGNILHFLLLTAPLLPLAFMEELGFRAYPLQLLKDKVGIRFSIFITSILFALYHIVNGWSVASSFLGPAVWGLVFGLAAVYAKGIAMPTGVHFAANVTTAAFSTADTAAGLWIVKPLPNAATAAGASVWATLLPSAALFVFAIICLELYKKQSTNSNHAWTKT